MTEPKLRYKLRKSQRLHNSWLYRQIRDKGRRLTHGCLILNWLERGDRNAPRVGFVVSRRIGSAVERNRARRLLRETFRLCQHKIKPGVDLILVARQGIEQLRQADVQVHFLRVLELAGLLRSPEGLEPQGNGSQKAS